MRLEGNTPILDALHDEGRKLAMSTHRGRISRVRVTRLAMQGRILIIPFYPGRVHVGADNSLHCFPANDEREALMHPQDWMQLKISLNNSLREVVTPSTIFGIPVVEEYQL